MSLEDWVAQHDRSFIHSKGGIVVYCRHTDAGYVTLFYLSDYKCSTVSGMGVYLMPRL